jgi:hypothetical protein
MIALEAEFNFVSSSKQYISCTSESEKVGALSLAQFLNGMPATLLSCVQEIISS